MPLNNKNKKTKTKHTHTKQDVMFIPQSLAFMAQLFMVYFTC